MTLEENLAADRAHLEAALTLTCQDRKFMAVMNLYACITHSGTFSTNSNEQRSARIDAFMAGLVELNAPLRVAIDVLDFTVDTAEDYPNRAALAEYASGRPAPTSLMSDEAQAKPLDCASGVVNVDTLRELRVLCAEHESWLKRMRALAPTANPKNHPTIANLRERDAIRLQINALATPEVIMQLLRIAMKEQGDV